MKINIFKNYTKTNWYEAKTGYYYSCDNIPVLFKLAGFVYRFIFPQHHNNIFWKIRFRLNPRQKWIRDYIEYYEWCDKDQLILDFMLGCVIDFVEGEKCFETVSYDDNEFNIKFANGLREVYEFAKNGRKEYEKQIDSAYDAVDNRSKINSSYDYIYADVNRLEEELDKKEIECLEWIVKNRKSLWC